MKWTEFPIISVGYLYKLKGCCSASQVQAESYYTDIILI